MPWFEVEDHGKHGYRGELHYGRLERDIPLPDGAKEDGVRASYHQGVVEIVLDAPQAHKSTVTVPVSFT